MPADQNRVAERHQARVFWFAVPAAIIAALLGYLAFEASLPPCGPPRDTTLGHIYWYVPLALLIAVGSVVALVGRRTHRSSTALATALVAALFLTLVGDVVVWFAFFAAGNCGE